MSTLRAGPLHTPHASRTPDSQQAPAASSAAAAEPQQTLDTESANVQQAPAASSAPAHAGAVSHDAPLYPSTHWHAPVASQTPCAPQSTPAHTANTATPPPPPPPLGPMRRLLRHSAPAAAEHVVALGGGTPPQYALDAAGTPVATDTHVTGRLDSPSVHGPAASHADQSPTTHPYATQGAVLQVITDGGGGGPPAQFASAVAAPPDVTQVTDRTRVPPPHARSHALQLPGAQ